jgi:hypothetical protein
VGTPLQTREDPRIDFDWAHGPPADGIPADNFSVRWTRTLPFDEGTYRFHAVVDDGVRLYLDGALLIDAWEDGEKREFAVDRTVGPGEHTLRVEYYENSAEAFIQIWWETLDSETQWRGQYYDNRELSGSVVLERDDDAIDFDWGLDAPNASLPADGFSARWVRTAVFDAAVYRFHVVVDDGVRFWLDGVLIVDEWAEGGAREIAVDRVLSEGLHELRVEYFEEGGNALIRIWWERADVPGEWQGQYYDNRQLTGNPVLVRQDRAVDFNWGTSAPANGLPADGFGVRWRRQADLSEGVYLFRVLVDDGVRLWVDGQLLIDEWFNSGLREITVDLPVTAGVHDLRVEYCERGGDALIHLWWEQLGTAPFPQWKGEYWPNPGFEGEPTLIRNDEAINFDWGVHSPAYGLPSDSFSASWRREITFEKGVYRFYARASDGIRVYIDGELLLDEWHESDGEQLYTFELTLSKGKYQFLVEYYEHTGRARVRFWWERAGN